MGVRKYAKDDEMAKKGYVPVAQAIKLSGGLHFTTIYKWIREEKIKALKVAGRIYVNLASFNKAIEPEPISAEK